MFTFVFYGRTVKIITLNIKRMKSMSHHHLGTDLGPNLIALRHEDPTPKVEEGKEDSPGTSRLSSFGHGLLRVAGEAFKVIQHTYETIGGTALSSVSVEPERADRSDLTSAA